MRPGDRQARRPGPLALIGLEVHADVVPYAFSAATWEVTGLVGVLRNGCGALAASRWQNVFAQGFALALVVAV